MNWIDWYKSRVKKFSGSGVTGYFQKLGPEVSIVCRNQSSVSSPGEMAKDLCGVFFVKILIPFMRVPPS